MARSLTEPPGALARRRTALAASAAQADGVAAALRSALADSDPAPLARPRSDTDGGTHSMHAQANARRPDTAPIDGLIRTRYTLVVWVACGHERIHTARQETGASARRSFALFRDLREDGR